MGSDVITEVLKTKGGSPTTNTVKELSCALRKQLVGITGSLTLHTLNLNAQTQIPKPGALNHKYILNLHPKPETLNLNPKP